uniref:Major coat protein L-A virus domain-containing protein n=1 Tax=Scheffersomyces coipomensis TaxID=1788519 RepID=M4MCW5_9ASCO|nr:putative protein [Scheffersomyces coipomensis]
MDGENYLYIKNGVTSADLLLIKIALSEWIADCPLGLAHSSPKLADDLFIRSDYNKPNERVDICNIQLSHIKQLIHSLVDDNHLEAEFYYAYSMICQIFATPCPQSAESTSWFKKPILVTMPKFYCVSGIDPLRFYSGESNKKAAILDKTYSDWSFRADLAVLHSIILNESIYSELGRISTLSPEKKVTNNFFSDYSSNKDTDLLMYLYLLERRVNQTYRCEGPYTMNFGASIPEIPTCEDYFQVEVCIKNKDAVNYYKLNEPPKFQPIVEFSDIKYVPILSDEFDQFPGELTESDKKIIVESGILVECEGVVKNEQVWSPQIGQPAVLAIDTFPTPGIPIFSFFEHYRCFQSKSGAFEFNCGSHGSSSTSEVEKVSRLINTSKLLNREVSIWEAGYGRFIEVTPNDPTKHFNLDAWTQNYWNYVISSNNIDVPEDFWN